MKVVLFCGGMGTRMRAYSESIPKPMVPIGEDPILWHLMRYYAHFGHTEFILCLGYGADVIRDWFRARLEMSGSEATKWTIHFVDTGIEANVGERLFAVQDMVRGEPLFLANYADGLSDVPIPSMVEYARRNNFVATFLGVRAQASFHVVTAEMDGCVRGIAPISETSMRINGGYFVLSEEIFDFMGEGEELVLRPFRRLMADDRLGMYRYDGFWACMDTFKEQQTLEDHHARGTAPWLVWNGRSQNRGTARPPAEQAKRRSAIARRSPRSNR